jgi:tetratricopeptide (TPR) repeat protein
VYSAREVGELLEISPARVRAWVRAGFLAPERGPRGDLRFSFQDLVLLRTAKGLVEARVAPARVRRALRKLREQLPGGRPLTAVAIGAEGNRVVVRDGRTRWNPESGQALFDFDVAELAEKVAPLDARQARAQKREAESADDWFGLGCTLEVSDPEEARAAYRRAIEIDPSHADALINLGRLHHEAHDLEAAERAYRAALAVKPDATLAAFNLAVALEGAGRLDEAIEMYRRTLELDARWADAHYNVARLYEKLEQPMAALRHLKAYRKLTGR